MAHAIDNCMPDVESAVAEWVGDVEDLLGRLQIAIELLQSDPGVASDAKAMMDELRGRIRGLRADVPRPDAVRTWLRALSLVAGTSRSRRPARFLNVAETSAGSPSEA